MSRRISDCLQIEFWQSYPGHCAAGMVVRNRPLKPSWVAQNVRIGLRVRKSGTLKFLAFVTRQLLRQDKVIERKGTQHPHQPYGPVSPPATSLNDRNGSANLRRLAPNFPNLLAL